MTTLLVVSREGAERSGLVGVERLSPFVFDRVLWPSLGLFEGVDELARFTSVDTIESTALDEPDGKEATDEFAEAIVALMRVPSGMVEESFDDIVLL